MYNNFLQKSLCACTNAQYYTLSLEGAAIDNEDIMEKESSIMCNSLCCDCVQLYQRYTCTCICAYVVSIPMCI